MAFKGPDVPHRTPRKRALEIGTDPKGFEGGIEICGECGLPVSVAGHSHYEDPVEKSRSTGSSAPAVRPQGNPFKVGG